MSNKIKNNFWESEESISRYSKIKYELYDIEAAYILKASILLNKSVKDIKILDLGCGGGRTTIPLHKLGYDVYGLDISMPLIRNLQNKIPKEKAIYGDATTLPFLDESFDIVFFSHNSIDYLYPYSNRQQCVREISRVLKNNGIFIFSSHTFTPIPYNISTLKNIIQNPKPIIMSIMNRSGYYIEKMQNGYEVKTYFTNVSNIKALLIQNNLKLINHTKTIITDANPLKSFLKSILGWERYYMAQNNGKIYDILN